MQYLKYAQEHTLLSTFCAPCTVQDFSRIISLNSHIKSIRLVVNTLFDR